MSTTAPKSALADKAMVTRAIKDSFAKLDPRVQIENPVMFLVWVSAILTTMLAIVSFAGIQDAACRAATSPPSP